MLSRKMKADAFAFTLDEPELMELFLNYPELQQMQCPINMLRIQQHQFEDDALNQRRQMLPQHFPVKEVQGRPVICY